MRPRRAPTMILSLNIEDLDLPNKRAGVRSKGGAAEWVFWQTGAALLLPRLLAGPRDRASVLGRSPTPRVRCPASTAAPLQVEPACHIVVLPSCLAKSPVDGRFTSFSTRRSACCRRRHQYADPLARSRHASVRSLERYARTGPEAVARHVAEHGPARRRR